MKKNVMLILPLALSIVSCGSKNKPVNIENFSQELDIVKNSNDIDEKYKAYLQCNDILKEIIKIKDKLSLNIHDENHDEKSTKYENMYWDYKTKLYDSMKKELKNESSNNYFTAKIGVEKVADYLSTDTSQFFYNRKLLDIDYQVIDDSFNKVSKDIEDGVNINTIYSDYEVFYSKLVELYNNSQLAYVYSCLYGDNKEYNDIATTGQNKTEIYQNKTYDLLQKLIKNDLYSSKVKELFELSDEEIDKINDIVIYSDKVNELLEQEATLVSEYNTSKTTNELKQLYIDLVNVRNQIANELNYNNYMEYIYKEIYARDYSLEQSLQLCQNIIDNKTIKKIYQKLGYQNSLTSEYYDTEKLYSIVSNESKLWEVINDTKKVVSDAENYANYIRKYGNYNFEVRSNKIDASYVTTIDSTPTYYMYIGATGSIMDYTTVIHEFGHYLGLNSFDENNIKSLDSSLEVCEMHSQSLEYLMTNYYSDFISKKYVSQMTNMQIFNALWVMQSAVSVFETEYYAYTTPNITISDLDSKFNNYVKMTTYPFSFGMDEYNNPTYVGVLHMYQMPGYYISYLTSLIPSLEIYALPIEEGIAKYNELIDYGPYIKFMDCVNKLNLSSPFDSSTIDTIAKKFEKNIK